MNSIKLLQKLVSQGALMQDGQGRWTKYRLSPKSDSVHKRVDSVHKAELSDSEMNELLKIAESARQSRRLSNKEMESTILELCQGRWLSRRLLAELVGRNADGLRSRFLTLMVEHGRLCLLYPEKPNRVDQAYTAP